jgi:hypothetical protein
MMLPEDWQDGRKYPICLANNNNNYNNKKR